jgi:hypothetical protein
MKKASCLSLVFLFLTAAVSGWAASELGTVEGLWAASLTGDQVRFRLTVFGEDERDEWNMSLSTSRIRLSGLEFDKDHSFKLTGDAGTITFQGKFSGTRGSGSFAFVPDPAFIEFLAGKKFGRLDDKKLLFLLIGNVDKVYVENLESLGYAGISSSRLVDLAIHRVSQEYIKEMQAVWGTNLTLSKILEFKIHGVSKEYVEEMAKIGFKELTPAKLLALKIHGLTAAYVQSLRSFGLGEISLDRALEFKIHGITKEYVDQMVKAGFKDLTSDDLLALKIHGIDKEYIDYCRELLKGKRELTPKRVIGMKISGI